MSVHNLPSPLNSVVVAPDGELLAASADGRVFFLSSSGEERGELQAGTTPIIQLAVSKDGILAAAATTRGSVAVIHRKERKLLHTLVGPGLPVWSVAFLPDNSTLLTGGTDAMIKHVGTYREPRTFLVATEPNMMWQLGRRYPRHTYLGVPGITCNIPKTG